MARFTIVRDENVRRGRDLTIREAHMDLTLLHPKVVHLPIALAVLMPLVSGGLLLAWWREWLPRRTWLVSVLLQALLVATSYAAIETGEADEDRVERVVAERFIEAHEEAAELFIWLAAGALLLYVATAAIRNERVAKLFAALSLVASLVVLGAGYRVGEAGGALVYTHGAANAFIKSGSETTSPSKKGAERPDDHDQSDNDD